MGVTGPDARLQVLARQLGELAQAGSLARQDIARGVVLEVRQVLKDQFATGVGPDGSPWQRTRAGKPALLSKKLPQDFRGHPVPEGAEFNTRIPWLRAQHSGHVFPARRGGGNSLFFDEKGRAFKLGKLNARGLRAKFVEEVVVKEHAVGQRELPARPIYPEDGITDRWGAAINRGGEAGMERFRQRTGAG